MIPDTRENLELDLEGSHFLSTGLKSLLAGLAKEIKVFTSVLLLALFPKLIFMAVVLPHNCSLIRRSNRLL